MDVAVLDPVVPTDGQEAPVDDGRKESLVRRGSLERRVSFGDISSANAAAQSDQKANEADGVKLTPSEMVMHAINQKMDRISDKIEALEPPNDVSRAAAKLHDELGNTYAEACAVQVMFFYYIVGSYRYSYIYIVIHLTV
jgi:hypothetical protein